MDNRDYNALFKKNNSIIWLKWAEKNPAAIVFHKIIIDSSILNERIVYPKRKTCCFFCKWKTSFRFSSHSWPLPCQHTIVYDVGVLKTIINVNIRFRVFDSTQRCQVICTLMMWSCHVNHHERITFILLYAIVYHLNVIW